MDSQRSSSHIVCARIQMIEVFVHSPSSNTSTIDLKTFIKILDNKDVILPNAWAWLRGLSGDVAILNFPDRRCPLAHITTQALDICTTVNKASVIMFELN